MRKMGNRNLWQAKQGLNLRLKTKFGLVIAIFSHLAKKKKRGRKRARAWLTEEEKDFVISSPCNQRTS